MLRRGHLARGRDPYSPVIRPVGDVILYDSAGDPDGIKEPLLDSRASDTSATLDRSLIGLLLRLPKPSSRRARGAPDARRSLVGMAIDPEGIRQIEQQVAAETSMRFQQALDAVTPVHLGCGDPERVTDALADELSPRGIYVETDEQRREIRTKFGEPIARGEAIGTVQPD